MSYSVYRQDYVVPLAAARADNAKLASFWIPAGESVEIFGLRAYMSTAGDDAANKMELVQDSTILATVTTGDSTGFKKSTDTFPMFVNGGTAGTVLHIVVDQTDTPGIGTLLLDMKKSFGY